MAGRGGARPGAGRRRGESKATIERRALAERILAEQAAGQQAQPGRKLAKEVLDDLMHLALQYAAVHQPLPPGMVATAEQDPNTEKFVMFANMAGDFAGRLAKFQSPTFKSIEVHADPSLVAPGVAAAGGGAVPSADGANRLTPQQAYRLLRDADVIDMPKTPALKKAANG